MTTEPEQDPSESADVRAARTAIEAHLNRTGAPAADEPEGGGVRPGGRRVDDRTAERIAREAWDAVGEATPPPPDPGTDRGGAAEPPEVAERRREAVAVVRGLQELGYRLDETLLPGPDMAAG